MANRTNVSQRSRKSLRQRRRRNRQMQTLIAVIAISLVCLIGLGIGLSACSKSKETVSDNVSTTETTTVEETTTTPPDVQVDIMMIGDILAHEVYTRVVYRQTEHIILIIYLKISKAIYQLLI